ncbi:hypothetical protein DPMN_039609 [Dreissena polymorpha]|uniref:Uncharacterized protein n=1 Tax=Dreissena polymorpha TaxID=45954 RepID=A0A9D4CV42_DREPO|nr:hypothetical protein DPMN_039609 [Dreissena polymorpha]
MSYVCYRIMWTGGAVAAMSSITYPAISAFVSAHAEADQQGNHGNVTAILCILCPHLDVEYGYG